MKHRITHILTLFGLTSAAIFCSLGIVHVGTMIWVPTAAQASFFLGNFQAAPTTVPGQISYQGYLTNGNGTPHSGTHSMTFAVYATAAGGTPLWSEVQNSVPVRNGYFTVRLGSTSALPADLFDQPSRYLGIKVDTNQEMVPRQPFASVPYAFHADKANALSAVDGDPADAVTVDNNGNVSMPNGDLTIEDGNLLLPNGSYSLVNGVAKFSQYGLRVAQDNATLARIPMGVGIAIARENPAVSIRNNGAGAALLVEAGKVGIGTLEPQTLLHVNGDVTMEGASRANIYCDQNGNYCREIDGMVTNVTRGSCTWYGSGSNGNPVHTYVCPAGQYLAGLKNDSNGQPAGHWHDSYYCCPLAVTR